MPTEQQSEWLKHLGVDDTASGESKGVFGAVKDAAGRVAGGIKHGLGAMADSAHAAWGRVRHKDDPAPAAPPASGPAQAADSARAAAKPEAPPKKDGPSFKGYPKGLEAGEKLLTQVKKYGFSEGIHATSSDAADREDTKEIWCSGLSNWSLLESGVDVDQKYAYDTGKKKKDPKTGEMVPDTKKMSIRSVVEGGFETFGKGPELEPMPTSKDYPDPAELKTKIAEAKARNKTAAETAMYAAYAQDGLFGNSAAEDDPRVKGAAGAFVIAKIGTEVLDLEDVKPGDYVQTRAVKSPKGHAFQISACHCTGEALIGPGGSPKLVKDLGGERVRTHDGIWYEKAQFMVDGKTDPAFVGKHSVTKTDVLESNVAKAMEDKKKRPDGGVQINHDVGFADPKTKRTYVGRLSSSSWAGYSRHAPALNRPEGESLPKGS